MCHVIKLELNLNQTMIRFYNLTNTGSTAAFTRHIHALFLDILTYVCLLIGGVVLAVTARKYAD